jgi:hypothetical protein
MRWTQNTWKRYTTTDYDDSDGIARVHGMNNVQAEELVEYGARLNIKLNND